MFGLVLFIMNNSTALPTNSNFERLGSTFAISLIVINACSSLVACVLNFLIILTFVKTPSMRTPSYILILCLAIADFGVGAVVQPVNCVELFAKMKGYDVPTTSSIRNGSIWILGPSSLLTITAITIDRFLALHLHLRYQEVVTTKRSCIAVIVVVTLSLFGIFAPWNNVFRKVYLSVLVVPLLLNVFLMVKISRAVSKHSTSIHAQEQSIQESMNFPRFKKTVNTMHCIMVTFVICYIPITITTFIRNSGQYKAPSIYYLTNTLMLINSAMNPVIYFWRIQDMRNAVVQLFQD